MTHTLTFCGAAQTVTGSCYLIEGPAGRFLIDCGMFQGSKTIKELNYGPFPFDPGGLDFVLLTHAHIDHAGLIPKLIKHGFKGPVHATQGTRDLLSYMLPDSGYIQEREVEHLNRRNRQRGRPAVSPIYTRLDGERALGAFRPVAYEDWVAVADRVRVRFWNAGHILGAASIEIEIADGQAEDGSLRLLFSGDIGPDNKLFHPDPEAPEDWDYVVCESTYGDRPRKDVSPEIRRRRLADEVHRALERKGVLLIPAFAVERTQELLADLALLMNGGVIPEVPTFLDSPLAIRATQVFKGHAGDLEGLSASGDLLAHPNVRFTETVEESKAIHSCTGGMIVIAASGMCDAGRIRHHLKRYLPMPETTLLLVGYQAPATLGSLLAEGARAVRIMGEDVRVRAKVKEFDLYSGHADRDGLVDWIAARLPVRRGVFLTHGEKAAIVALRERVIGLGLASDRVHAPVIDDRFDLDHARVLDTNAEYRHRIEPEVLGRPDWHNDLARFSLDLRDALDAAADEKSRAKILRRVRRALAGEDA